MPLRSVPAVAFTFTFAHPKVHTSLGQLFFTLSTIQGTSTNGVISHDRLALELAKHHYQAAKHLYVQNFGKAHPRQCNAIMGLARVYLAEGKGYLAGGTVHEYLALTGESKLPDDLSHFASPARKASVVKEIKDAAGVPDRRERSSTQVWAGVPSPIASPVKPGRTVSVASTATAVESKPMLALEASTPKE